MVGCRTVEQTTIARRFAVEKEQQNQRQKMDQPGLKVGKVENLASSDETKPGLNNKISTYKAGRAGC